MDKQQVVVRPWRKGNRCALLVGMQTGAPLWKMMQPPYDPVTPVLGIHPGVYAPISSFFSSQDLEKPECSPVDECVKRRRGIYTMEHYSAVRKKETLALVTAWMELEIIMLSEISQSEKDKYHMISLTCRI